EKLRSVSDHIQLCIVFRRAALAVHGPKSPKNPMLFLLFFNHPATTDIYTLSLHDALPISLTSELHPLRPRNGKDESRKTPKSCRSEEHTSELQSQSNIVCRLLLEKKNARSRWVLECLRSCISTTSSIFSSCT